MTSHESCTSGTSRDPKVASLQRLKMEPLIPAPADCEVRSVIMFSKAQSFQMHRCFEYRSKFIVGCARPMGLASWASRWCVAVAENLQQVGKMMRSAVGVHPSLRTTSRPVISIFSYTSRNYHPVSVRVSEWQRGGDECHTVVSIPSGRLLQHRDANVGPTVW